MAWQAADSQPCARSLLGAGMTLLCVGLDRSHGRLGNKSASPLGPDAISSEEACLISLQIFHSPGLRAQPPDSQVWEDSGPWEGHFAFNRGH